MVVKYWCGVALLAAAPLIAQVETGQLTGIVRDPSGAVVVNATVSLVRQGTEVSRSAQTNEEGIYLFTNVLPSDYQVRVAAANFSTKQLRVSVAPGQRVGLDVELEVGTAETVVQVTENVGQVNTVSETVGGVIGTREIVDLPSLTRNPYDFVGTLGNVSPNDPSGRGAGFAINGLRSAGTNVLLDGGANNDEFTGSTGQNIPLDSVQEYSVATTNFTAEVGRATAGVVNLVTKTGTNDFRGSVYWFNRVSALGSNDFNNNANGIRRPVYTRNQPGYSIGGPIVKNKLYFFQSSEWIRVRSQASTLAWIPSPQLVGASAPETRQFFQTFGTPRSNLQTLETLSRGQLSARGFDPCRGGAAGGACSTIDPNLPLFSRVQYNVPANSGGGDPQNTYFQVARIDYNLSERTQIFGRYALERVDLFAGTIANSPYSGFDTGQANQNNSILVSAIHTFSPTLVSQSKAVYNRLTNTQPLGERPATPTLYFGNQSAPSILGVQVGAPGYLPFNPGSAIPFGGPQNFIQLYQDLNWTRGKHNFRFGGSYNYLQDNRTFGAYLNSVVSLGTNFGQAMDNLLQGQARGFNGAINPQGKFPCVGSATPACTVTLPVGSPSFSRSFRYHEFALYGQDTWRLTGRLTLNLGLRYEYFGTQRNNRSELDSNFYLGDGGTFQERIRNGQVLLADQSPQGGLWRPQRWNFAPRLGFAYDLTGDGRGALRGGYGIGYERNFGNVTFNVIQNPPNYAVLGLVAGVDVPRIPISTGLAGPLAGSSGSRSLPPVTLRAVDPDIRPAYAQFWNLSIERQVVPGWIAAAEYVGSKGSRLYSISNINAPGGGNVYLRDACTQGDPFSCNARLNRQYGNINWRGNDAESIYHGLNLSNTFRNIAQTGVNMRVNYTWSHAIDTLSDVFSSAGVPSAGSTVSALLGQSGNGVNLGFLDPFNPRIDRGNADFDVRHRLVIAGTWDLPLGRSGSSRLVRLLAGGWTFAPIFTARTGQYYSLFDSTNAYYFFTPRASFNQPVPRNGQGDRFPTAQPNTWNFQDLSTARLDNSVVNPITGSGEFGPFPSNMSGRNVFRGPNFWNLDAGVYKTIDITERVRTQLRFEVYNVFNHANLFATGGTDLAVTDFVPAFRAGNRNVQLALKILF